jgi:hypothetical protein
MTILSLKMDGESVADQRFCAAQSFSAHCIANEIIHLKVKRTAQVPVKALIFIVTVHTVHVKCFCRSLNHLRHNF